MAEVINTNVFDAEKKFVDFAGLDYFWEKAKKYVDDADKVTADKVAALEGVVGDDASGLVQKVNLIQGELDGLNGGAGSITTQITNALAGLDVEDAAVEGQYVSSVAEVDGKVVVTRANLPVYEKVGTAEGFNTAMDERVKVLEAINHDQLAADAASSAVATVLDGAPEKFDTLKEIAAWIAEADTAEDAASLVTRVGNIETTVGKEAEGENAASGLIARIGALEAIDHDAYVGADEDVLDEAKAHADGLVKNADGTVKFEAVGIAEGLVNDLANGAVKTNTEAIAVINGNAETEGSIAKAKADAIAQADADAAETLKAYYTSEEVDGLVDALNGNIDSAQAAAEAYAKTYTDALFTSFKFATNAEIDGIFTPKAE